MKTVWRSLILIFLSGLILCTGATGETSEEAEIRKGTINGKTSRSVYNYVFLNYDNTVSVKDTIQNTYSRKELAELSCDLARRAGAGTSGRDSAGLYEASQIYEPECLRCMGQYSYCVLRLDDGTYAFVVFRSTWDRNVAYLFTVLQNRMTAQELLNTMRNPDGKIDFSYIAEDSYCASAEEDLYLNEWLTEGMWCVRDEASEEIVYTFYCLDGYLEIHEGKFDLQNPQQYKKKTAVIRSYDDAAAVRYGWFLETDMREIYPEGVKYTADTQGPDVPARGMIQGRYRIRTFSTMSVSYDNTTDPKEVIKKVYSREELVDFIDRMEKHIHIGNSDMCDFAERYDLECVRDFDGSCYVILHLDDDTYAFIGFQHRGSLIYLWSALQTRATVQELTEMIQEKDGSVNLDAISKDCYNGHHPYYEFKSERFKDEYWGLFGSDNVGSGYRFYCTDGIVAATFYDGSLMRNDPRYGTSEVKTYLYKDMYDQPNWRLSEYLKKDIVELFDTAN